MVLVMVHQDYIRPAKGRGRGKEGKYPSGVMRSYCNI